MDDVTYIHTVYGKATGMEIKTFVKKNTRTNTEEGAVALRFFGFGEKSSTESLSFHITPVECHSAALQIEEILRSKEAAAKHTMTQKFNKNGEEIITGVTFERWARDGKSGYGASIKRGTGSPTSVGIKADELSFVAAFLRKLAVEQSWQRLVQQQKSEPAVGSAQQHHTQEAPAPAMRPQHQAAPAERTQAAQPSAPAARPQAQQQAPQQQAPQPAAQSATQTDEYLDSYDPFD